MVVVAGVVTAVATDWFKDVQDDTTDSPVDVRTSMAAKPWQAWVSDEDIDVSPTAIADDYGFPGPDRAVHTGRPITDASGDAYSGQFSFDLIGKVNSPLRISRITAVIDSMTASPNATFAYFVPQGDSPKGQIGFDFRRQEPFDAVKIDEYGEFTDERYLDTRTVTVGDHEAVGFQVLALAPENADVRFHVEVLFDNGATTKVDDQGKPFRVVGFPSSPKKVYVPTMPDLTSPTGLYECRWKEGCDASFNTLLRDSLP